MKKSEKIKALLTDRAEYRLLEQVEKGNFQAIKFVLTTMGKERGYIEKTESEENRILEDLKSAWHDLLKE